MLDTETLIVDVKAGLLYPLNSVGTMIWQLCDGRRTVEEIIQRLTEEFEADEATVRDDTMIFVRELAQARLLSLDHKPYP